ncbi:MAG: signal peptide peptidase SppA, partial [Candidatus Cloacimonetes bacterium]|nr:signal peptide peptidase SppA [Candidatus Cloacimonadota bacterium]
SEPEMTDAERLVYDSLLSDFYAGIIEQIGSGRGERLLKPVAQLVDEGPYWIAQDALDAGLVDKLIYLDELEEQLKIDFGYGRDMATLKDYKDYNWSRPKEHQIAVIYAQGNIVGGKGLPGKQIAAETTVDLIRKARNNPMYKGIILRVDSGGGSAFASDVILRELELAKTKNKKPVVVSMAGAAASGGYYIACKADKIVAEPGTITGSIGVVGIIPNAEKMFKKIKINWSTVKKGMRSDIGSMTRAMKDDEKAMVSKMIKNTYDDFISHVAEGRELEIEAVHKIAQGRVWTGSQAKDLGLVDELGGMETAKGIITSLANIKGKVSLIDATSSHKGIQITMDDEGFGIFAPLGALKDISSEYVQLYEFWKNYEDDPILMLSPLTGENIEQ